MDGAESFEQLLEAEFDSLVKGAALQQAAQHEREDTIEGMDADFRIRPVKHGLPTEKVRVFHVGKSVFDVRLGAVGQNDLFIGPVVVVGEQDALVQLILFETGIGGGIGSIGQLE